MSHRHFYTTDGVELWVGTVGGAARVVGDTSWSFPQSVFRDCSGFCTVDFLWIQSAGNHHRDLDSDTDTHAAVTLFPL